MVLVRKELLLAAQSARPLSDLQRASWQLHHKFAIPIKTAPNSLRLMPFSGSPLLLSVLVKIRVSHRCKLDILRKRVGESCSHAPPASTGASCSVC